MNKFLLPGSKGAVTMYVITWTTKPCKRAESKVKRRITLFKGTHDGGDDCSDQSKPCHSEALCQKAPLFWLFNEIVIVAFDVQGAEARILDGATVDICARSS